MSKQKFIIAARDKGQPANETLEILAALHRDEPECFIKLEDESPIAEEMILETQKHLWTEKHYNVLLSNLETLDCFSYERCLYLTKVKEKLQKDNIRGFSLSLGENNKSQLDINNKEFTKKADELNIQGLLGGYKAPASLSDALKKSDISLVRSMLIADLNHSKLDVQEVLKMGIYAETQNAQIFEPYAVSLFAQAIDENSVSWNQNYFSMQLVYLNKNFSRERFLHLINVSKAIFSKQEKKETSLSLQSEPQQNAQEEPKKTEYIFSKPSYKENNDIWKTALKIGGVVASAILVLIAIFK